MGLLTAATATGSLIFLPAMAWIADHGGWRPVVLTVAAVAAIMAPICWLLIPESPDAIGPAAVRRARRLDGRRPRARPPTP